jgi:predicted GNAT family N-acyltransferase
LQFFISGGTENIFYISFIKQEMKKLIDEINIRLITFGTKEYDAEVKLRDDTLRKPLGLSLYDEDLSKEINDYHIGAFIGKDLVGIVILTRLNNDEMKMRQMGVDEAHRGIGIASSLIQFAETFCINAGYRKIVLSARAQVKQLYENLGYKTIGNSFIEVTIPHFKMFKQL